MATSFRKSLIAALVITSSSTCSSAFHVVPASRNSAAPTAMHAAPPSPEESAKALTDYMAKAHEEKLKAVKAAEEKKQAEIEALKTELERVKSSAITTTTTAPSTGSSSTDIAELQQKLIAYQNFMAKYIVDAQEQKAKAVADAQASILAKLSLPAAPPAMAPAVPKLYQDRMAKVSAAAAAGKSRWGDAEVTRLASGKASAPLPSPAAPAVPAVASAATTTTASMASSPEVLAADHGLRNDGGVGGPSLAERVASGALTSGVNAQLHQNRNARVSAAADKSRWGDAELTRLASGKAIAPKTVPAGPAMPAVVAAPAMTLSATSPPPEVIEADHGLRNDGGVGGPTLAERVAYGPNVISVMPAAVNGAVVHSASTSPLYYKRNQNVAAAGAKSRWGPMEVAKATKLASAPPAVAETPEIKAADHGLRADGGVAGPSLAERVNLGAQLMGLK